MTHNPRIFWNGAAATREQHDEVYGLFAEVRKRVAESRPDALIVVSNDHLDNFFLDTMPQFCVGIAEQASGPFWYESEIMHIPSYRARVDVVLAKDLLEAGVSRGIDFAQAGEFRLDHAFTVPLSVARPEQDLPIVPVFTNTFAYPLATPERFLAVGRTIRELIRGRPAAERIAVVATFNLSVEVGGPKMGTRDQDLDREALELIGKGRAQDILDRFPVERLMAAGNSTAEFLNYHAVLGLVEDRVPDLCEYRQVPAWGGCPIVVWNAA